MAEADTRVFVQGLPPSCDVASLKAHFGAYEVTDVKIPKKKGAKSQCRGIAFVGFRSPEDAARAIKKMDKAYWRTSKLRVFPAQRREGKRTAPEAATAPPEPPKKKTKKAAPVPEARASAKQTRAPRLRRPGR